MSEFEWRRHWRPTFSAEPWRRLPQGQGQGSDPVTGPVYFIKCQFVDSNCSCQVLVTDCTSTWYESVDQDLLRKRTKKLNPSIEAPMGKLLDHIREQFDNFPSATEFTVSKKIDGGDTETAHLQLEITSRLAGLPFIWKFNASPADKVMISENLLLPLLTMVSESRRRQRELFKLLAAKDKEIEDLRAQGAKSTRRHLETGPFDTAVFLNDMDTAQTFEDQVRRAGSDAFDTEGQKLYREIMTRRAWLQSTPPEEAEGDSLIDDPSGPSEDSTAAESWTNRIPPSVVGQSATTTMSPMKSPAKSPAKTPSKSSPEPSPAKDTELLRRQALERRLQEEEKKNQKASKKKKIKF